jgi:NAD(P)-dependent dehydrogenase (short-subunit alcohol dehydrogenase family)
MEVGGTNRALVIGARGVLGALTVRALRAAGWVVRSGARRPLPGQVEIDLGRPDSVAAAVDEHELVVNTVPHPDLLAERYVLEHGGALINVSDLPAAAGRALRAVAGGARGTVVMNAGLAPGVTTIVAGDLLARHPAAGELEIVFTVSMAVPRGPASADFIHRGLTGMARHRTALVPLPTPFGERRCLGFGEGDAGWLGGIAEGRIVRQYVCIAEPAVHERLLELNSVGAMADLPRSLIGLPKQRADGTASNEPVVHWIAAIRAGRRLSVRTVECLGGFLGAARSTVVFADALRAQSPPNGCFDPEEIWTLSDVEDKLRAAGIRVVSPDRADMNVIGGSSIAVTSMGDGGSCS